MVADMRPLSGSPARKILVECTKCGLLVQYDRDAMLAAGGDRTLGELLDSSRGGTVARWSTGRGFSPYQKCGASLLRNCPRCLRRRGGVNQSGARYCVCEFPAEA